MSIIGLAVLFYANDALISLTQTERLQKMFDVLTGLFHRVVLWKNTGKMAVMVYQPCHAPGGMLE